MSDPGKAVFLSYASQDAESAQRIAEALRGAGLEVWFDKNELAGGDAWDAKIRRQIKECALFVPVISAATNARAEGYFRLEWKLAVDRSHLMADDAPFLFPIVIGDVADGAARVPDKFREVQWTRLRLDETPSELASRVAKLLGGAPGDPVRPAMRGAGASGKPGKPAWVGYAWTVLGLVFAVVYGLRPAWQSTGGDRGETWDERRAAKAQPATPLAPAAPVATQDPRVRRVLEILDSTEVTVADVTLAEDLAKAALNARPTDVAATLAMGRVQVYYLLRGYDRGEERFALAKLYAERGLALAPDDPDAMAIMATYLYRRGVELPRALKLLRQAIALRPEEPYSYRILDNVLSVTPDVTDAEIIASARITAERFPRDALVQYELARHYRDGGMLAETERYFQRAVELGPVIHALLAQASLKLFVHGDVPGVKKLLDQVPERHRGSGRTVFTQFSYAMVTGQSQDGLDALRSLPEPWMIDFDYTGPTALLAGELYLQQGKGELARLRFNEALEELGRHKPDLQRNFSTLWLEPWLLMRLGRIDEAKARNKVSNGELRRPYRLALGTNWWFNPITSDLLLGERAAALELMRESAGFPHGLAILRNAFRLDPRMAPFRDDPEFVALLAAAPAAKS